MIYVDHNATTALDSEVLEAMMPYLTTRYGNAASVHRFGSQLMSAIDEARQQVSQLLGAGARDDITFTSGGTESNNTAIHAIVNRFPERRHIVTSRVEHSSVGRALDDLDELQKRAAQFREQTGRWPQSFQEMISLGLLGGIPADPQGFPYQLQPNGEFSLHPDSTVQRERGPSPPRN